MVTKCGKIENRNKQSSHRLYPPVNEYEAAELLGVSVRTLQKWRYLRKGPAYLKISNRVRYAIEDLKSFRDENRVDPREVVKMEKRDFKRSVPAPDKAKKAGDTADQTSDSQRPVTALFADPSGAI